MDLEERYELSSAFTTSLRHALDLPLIKAMPTWKKFRSGYQSPLGKGAVSKGKDLLPRMPGSELTW